MVIWINRHKRLIQWIVVALGLLLLGPVLYRIYAAGLSTLAGRLGEKSLKGLSKPAEAGIYLLIALLAARLALKLPVAREIARALFRLLQVIHRPLGAVVFASAALHGLGFLIFHWKNDLRSWSGVVALLLLVATVVFGLRSIRRPGRKRLHLILGLVTFAATMLHLLAPGVDGPGERHDSRDRRPPQPIPYTSRAEAHTK